MSEENSSVNNGMTSKSFSALIRGIQHAASTANSVASRHLINVLDQFFDEEEGRLKAKMTHVQVDDNHWMPIPLISLVSPSVLNLDTMKVSLNVRIDEAFTKPAAFESDKDDLDRLALRVSFAPKENAENHSDKVATVEVAFKSNSTPDAINRIIETYSNMIRPIAMDDTPPPEKTSSIKPKGSTDNGAVG